MKSADPTKLDRLLELRRHEEQRRTVELVASHRALDEAERTLEQLRAQRREIETKMENLHGESVGQFQTHRLLLEQLDQGIRNATTVMSLASAKAGEMAEALEQASKDREALERVVVPRREQAQALERVAEQKVEDEAALTRFRREGGSRS